MAWLEMRSQVLSPSVSRGSKCYQCNCVRTKCGTELVRHTRTRSFCKGNTHRTNAHIYIMHSWHACVMVLCVCANSKASMFGLLRTVRATGCGHWHLRCSSIKTTRRECVLGWSLHSRAHVHICWRHTYVLTIGAAHARVCVCVRVCLRVYVLSETRSMAPSDKNALISAGRRWHGLAIS